MIVQNGRRFGFETCRVTPSALTFKTKPSFIELFSLLSPACVSAVNMKLIGHCGTVKFLKHLVSRACSCPYDESLTHMRLQSFLSLCVDSWSGDEDVCTPSPAPTLNTM